MQKATVILGAGFSVAVGFPATAGLFESSDLPPTKSSVDLKRMDAVRSSYLSWKRDNPGMDAEQWLLILYKDRNELSNMIHGTNWYDAIQFGLRRLTKLRDAFKQSYYYGITHHESHEYHNQFWEKINKQFDLTAIVSMNYDLLVERALHTPNFGAFPSLRFYYGGLDQKEVKKWRNLSKVDGYQMVPLGSEIELFKLHGSLNWAWEPHSPERMKIHDDVRAIFRQEKNGSVAIVPPIPEKEMPEMFKHIWRGARESLEAASIWIVCGYSKPEYDIALCKFFDSCAQEGSVEEIIILDPDSTHLQKKWAYPGVELRLLQGLPDGIAQDWN